MTASGSEMQTRPADVQLRDGTVSESEAGLNLRGEILLSRNKLHNLSVFCALGERDSEWIGQSDCPTTENGGFNRHVPKEKLVNLSIQFRFGSRPRAAWVAENGLTAT